MRPITDADLVLFHYRDGLDAARLAEIATALAADAALSQRYMVLRATLDAADLDRAPEPSAAFATRMQDHVARLTAASAHAPPPSALRVHGASRRSRRRRNWRLLASGAAAVLLLAIGFHVGQNSQPLSPVEPTPLATATPKLDAARIYQATLAAHLGSTRQALLTAVNDTPGEFEQGNALLAAALIENNRLYLAAAEASGDRRLAEVLRALEPVLIELANPAGSDDIQLRKGVSDYVERSDLLFQVRAAEAGLRSRTVTRT